MTLKYSKSCLSANFENIPILMFLKQKISQNLKILTKKQLSDLHDFSKIEKGGKFQVKLKSKSVGDRFA